MADTMELLTRRATLAPATADPEARTVEVKLFSEEPLHDLNAALPLGKHGVLDGFGVKLARQDAAVCPFSAFLHGFPFSFSLRAQSAFQRLGDGNPDEFGARHRSEPAFAGRVDSVEHVLWEPDR